MYALVFDLDGLAGFVGNCKWPVLHPSSIVLDFSRLVEFTANCKTLGIENSVLCIGMKHIPCATITAKKNHEQ